MILHQDFKEFIELLNSNNVEYLLIGGYAVVLYGYVRSTGDIDIWINRTPENADRIIKSLNEFGFGSVGLTQKDFIEIDRIIQLGYPPYRIDIITSIEGLDFNECYSKKIFCEIESGCTVKLIDIDNLIKTKNISGRNKDLDDIEKLRGK